MVHAICVLQHQQRAVLMNCINIVIVYHYQIMVQYSLQLYVYLEAVGFLKPGGAPRLRVIRCSGTSRA